MRVLLVKDVEISEHTIDDDNRILEMDKLAGAMVDKGSQLPEYPGAMCCWSSEATDINAWATELTGGRLIYGPAIIAETGVDRIVGLRPEYARQIQKEMKSR